MFFAFSALAQEGSNPFDLKYRLNHSELNLSDEASAETPLDSIENNKEVHSTNPFDIKASTDIKKLVTPEKAKKEDIFPTVTKQKKGISSTSLFWILIFLTLLLAVIINLNRSILNNLAKAWTNLNFSNLLHRERKGPDRLLYLLLGLLFYCNAGLFVSHVANTLFDVTLSYKLLLLSILSVILIYGVRHLVLLGISRIFSLSKEINQYSFTIHLFNILNGIILLITNYIVSFAPQGIAKTAIYLGILFLVLQFVYRNIRGLLLGSKFIAADRVHFFLYLCTCEIIPLIIGFKLIRGLV